MSDAAPNPLAGPDARLTNQPRPRTSGKLTARPRVPAPPRPQATPPLLVPSGAWHRPVRTVAAPLLNGPVGLQEAQEAHDGPIRHLAPPEGQIGAPGPPEPPERPPWPRLAAEEGAEARDRTARAVLAVLEAFRSEGAGCRVIQTTPGIRERCAALAERGGTGLDSSGHS